MDLNDITDFETAEDARERHDIVMQLASEATEGEPHTASDLSACVCLLQDTVMT